MPARSFGKAMMTAGAVLGLTVVGCSTTVVPEDAASSEAAATSETREQWRSRADGCRGLGVQRIVLGRPAPPSRQTYYPTEINLINDEIYRPIDDPRPHMFYGDSDNEVGDCRYFVPIDADLPSPPTTEAIERLPAYFIVCGSSSIDGQICPRGSRWPEGGCVDTMWCDGVQHPPLGSTPIGDGPPPPLLDSWIGLIGRGRR